MSEIEIDGKVYQMKSPPSKHIPKILTLQGKDFKKLEEADWEIMRAAIYDGVKRANPDWSEDETDEFVTENFMPLLEKLPVVMGWVTEEELKEGQKKS